jgi:hypothetical protein
MTIRWKPLVTNLAFWLFVELWLGFLGLDNLADYGEFLQKIPPQQNQPAIFVVLI